MFANLSKMYVSYLAFIMGTLTGFFISKWPDIGFQTWRMSEVESLVTRWPECGPLTWRGPEVRPQTRMIYNKPDLSQLPRNDVMILTPWLAPIVWEGTFNHDILMEEFQYKNYTVGLLVSVTSKYVILLKRFLESAEKYFLKGVRVNYYVFTDQPNEVKTLDLKLNRSMEIITLPHYSSWQKTVLARMEVINHQTELLFNKEVDYIASLDVDMEFLAHIGVEILGELVAALHPAFYHTPRHDLPYERRPASQAFIPKDEGDFYYQGNFYLGTVQKIYQLTTAYHKAIMIDKANDIEARVFEESHLNKQLVYNKPTKLLSPEYIWSNSLGSPKDIKIKRVEHGKKTL
ncbi:histo-blood group ABO system transferase 1-like isoform X1 [Rhinatrema bivittatum]|uniref:histo-blood group ABO system transferase 1-like isoform X1 n=1 Tax=Rhinatrema bivittatum TaxID=194408 RepID=UPI00112D99FE|nr:histo-blood group ABO system transferase 1-like isoform X1 [Rhinatrema bivittatum]